MQNNNDIYLIVLRHGRCEEGDLSPSGKTQIKAVAKELEKENLEPDLFITSPTARTRQSSSIIRNHFNSLAKEREYNLFFEKSEDNSEIIELLKTIDNKHQNILISGHAETVNSFTYHVLQEEDCKKLFQIAETEKLHDYLNNKRDYIATSAAQGEVLILKSLKTSKNQNIAGLNWQFFGYITEGKLNLAIKITSNIESLGKKKSLEKNFPILMFER